MTKQSFIKGTLILLAAGIVNRILGFIPRITLPRVIGAEGIGLYQMGYPFLIVILTIVTGGIPIAVAKLVAAAEAEGDEAKVRSIFRMTMALSIVLSSVFTVGTYFGARRITEYLFTDDRVYLTFLCMTPIIFVVGISAVFRGYFQGRHNMIPTALSQVVETIVRIVTVLAFAYLMLPYGIAYAAAGAMVGVLAGEICALLVLMLLYRQARKREQPAGPVKKNKKTGAFSRIGHLKQIVTLALPVTGSKLVGSCSYLLESILIVHCLAAAGVATNMATAQYGALQGMVMPVLLLPSALTYSLAVSLIPSLSEASALGDMKTIHKRLHQSLKLALVTGAPFAVIMYVLAEPICLYMYGQAGVGPMLKMMAPAALFIYFQAPLQAALQALERPGSALVNTLAGSTVKLLLIYMLASNPKFGILGAVVAITINIMLVTVLHWNSIARLLKFSMNAGDFLKVGLSMAAAGVTCQLVMFTLWTGSGMIRFLASCCAGMVVYLLVAMLLKLFDRSDVFRLFWLGKRFVK